MKLIPMMLVLGLFLSLCNIADKLKGTKNESASPSSANSNDAGKSDKSGLPQADKPAPTGAQTAAIAGGQSVTWDQQGITWTLPAKWTEVSKSTSQMFNWKSPGSWDAAFIISNVSVLPPEFPTDISIKGMYDSAAADMKSGKYEDVKWLELDGIRGIMTREPRMENKEDSRRLQWRGYRKYAGQIQLVSIILSSQSQHFDMHADAMYGILYSSKVIHE